MIESNRNNIVEIKNLTIGYQSKKAIHKIASNINISIDKNQFIAVLGKNGIGKSTLLRTISKVQKPLSGEVFIESKNINDFTNKELAKTLSLVLTERLPESQLTVFELVALGRQPYTNWVDQLSEEDIRKVNSALHQTEIEHLKHKRYYELSDGQLQRVLIARALAQDTDIIILDEPTAHLDLNHTIKIFKLLEKLVAKTAKTIILSTHQINLAIQCSNYILLFTNDGLFSGRPKDLIEKDYFDNLFPKETVNFDRDLQQFIINHK